MTDVVDQLETGRPEPRRDQYDRAMLLNAQGHRVPFTRVSTIAKALDDKGSLINYNQRLTAVGLTKRKDLLDIVAMMADPEGNDKRELRALVEEAAVAGGQGVKANMGTARHKATERIDAGTPIEHIMMPDDIKRDIEAYYKELDRVGLRPLPQYNEVHVVRDGFDYNGLGYSGSFDKALGNGSDLFIGDIKTGQELKYAFLAWAVQQSMYANAESIYDVRTDVRTPMPKVRQDIAFIIWLPAGRGKCEILEVDIANGWRYAQLAVEFRRVRAHGRVDIRRDGCLVRKYEPVVQPTLSVVRGDDPGSVVDSPQQRLVDVIPTTSPVFGLGAVQARIDEQMKRRTWLKQRLVDMPDEGRALVAEWWSQWNARSDSGGIAGFLGEHMHTTQELDTIQTWVDEAEKHTQHDLSADPTVVNTKSLLKHFPGTIDEGTQLTDDQLVGLSANLGLWCHPPYLSLLQEWREQAIRLGRDFGIKECPTTRRLALYELGANLCNQLEGNMVNLDMAWAVLATGLGWQDIPDTEFGLAFSLLSIEDIEKCMDVVRQIPFLALHFDANTGCPTWGPVPAS